jgi:hypothetical protein
MNARMLLLDYVTDRGCIPTRPSFADVWLKLAKWREISSLFSPYGPASGQVNAFARRA